MSNIRLNSPEVSYDWSKHYSNPNEAMATAERFHEALRGNEDYIESRIILNVTGIRVSITEFSDSLTTVRVKEDNRGLAYLEVFAPKRHSAGHILGKGELE